jgi:hypothetical protein
MQTWLYSVRMSTARNYAQILLKSPRQSTASFEPFSHETTVAIDSTWLGSYAECTGLVARDGNLSLPVLQVLAGAMHLDMLADARMPRSAVGIVHLRNSLERFAELPALGEWNLRAEICARHSSQGALTGVVIVTTAKRPGDSEPRWRSTVEAVWPSKRKGKSNTAHGASAAALRDDVLLAAAGEHIEVVVPEDTGRHYARVSGDYNLIHLHALSARVFGFRKAIAHGMWTVARLLGSFDEGSRASNVEIEFRKPLFLPSKVQFSKLADGKQLICASEDRTKCHVVVQLGA